MSPQALTRTWSFTRPAASTASRLRRRAQFGIEYLALTAFLLTLVIVIFIYTTQMLGIESQKSQAKRSADDLSDAISFVTAQGYPAKTDITITLPENIQPGSRVIDNSVIIVLRGTDGTYDITSNTNSCGNGTLPSEGGMHTIHVAAQPDGCALITT